MDNFCKILSPFDLYKGQKFDNIFDIYNLNPELNFNIQSMGMIFFSNYGILRLTFARVFKNNDAVLSKTKLDSCKTILERNTNSQLRSITARNCGGSCNCCCRCNCC